MRQGRFEMKTVSIDRVIPNHKRNFDVYPIDDAVVESLMASYEQTGDFGVIPVRQIGDGPSVKYEQGCGHHRLEAMRRLGHVNVAVKVAQFSDHEMTMVMVNENATQAGGNPAAIADSVLAVVTDFVYGLFVSDNDKKFAQICANFGEAAAGQSAFTKLKNKALSGDITGDVVCVAMGGKIMPNGHAVKGGSPLTPKAISSSLAQLRADGVLYGAIMAEKDRFDLEMKAKTREEERKAEESRKAEIAAKELERQAKQAREAAEEKAAKLKAEADRKTEEAKKAKAKADFLRAEQEAERLKKQAELHEAQRKKAEDERKEREQKIQLESLRRKEEEERREAGRQKAEEAKFLSAGLQEKFDNNAQFDAFCAVVKGNPMMFPVKDQKELVETMMGTLRVVDDKEERPTAAKVKHYMQAELTKRDANLREEYEAARAAKQAEAEREATSNLARRVHKELGTAIGRMAAVVRELDKLTASPEFIEAFLNHPHGNYVPGELESLYRNIPKLCQKLRIAEERISKTDIVVEKVIDS